jgi:probable F420-dependent oxidoreductase
MKFGTPIAMIEPAYYLPLVQAAEDAGFDTVAVPDSIAYPRESANTYPYNFDGTREFLENKPFIEPTVAVAAMSAVTTTIEFHTFVVKLPIRNPVIYAKEVSSLAVMTGNRFVFGVGSSPWPDDYEITNLPWEGRGRRFDECIEVIRGLCTGEYFEFHGECYDFPAIKMQPVPAEPIPVLIGGHGDVNLRRAARIGDGWMSAGDTIEGVTEKLARIDDYRKEYGTTGRRFDVYATTMESFSADGIKQLEDLGVTHTSGGFGTFNPYANEADSETLQQKIDALNRYADEVIAKVR